MTFTKNSIGIPKNRSRNKLFIPLDVVKRSDVLDKIEVFFLAVDDAVVSLGKKEFPKPIELSDIIRHNSGNEDIKTVLSVYMASVEPYFRTKEFYSSDYAICDNSRNPKKKVDEIESTLNKTIEKIDKLYNDIEKLKVACNHKNVNERIENKKMEIEELNEKRLKIKSHLEKTQRNVPMFIIPRKDELPNDLPFTEMDYMSKDVISPYTPYTTVSIRFFDRRKTGEISKLRSAIWADCKLYDNYQRFWKRLKNAIRVKNGLQEKQVQTREEHIPIDFFWNSLERMRLKSLYDTLVMMELIEPRKFNVFTGIFSGYFHQNKNQVTIKRKVKWLAKVEGKSKHSNVATLYWLVIALKDLKLFYTYYYNTNLKDKHHLDSDKIINFIAEYIDLPIEVIINRIRLELSIDALKIITKYFTYEDGTDINTGDIYYPNMIKPNGENKSLDKYTKTFELLDKALSPFIKKHVEYERMCAIMDE